ncbi:MAG TPA: hypothetical protein VFA09_24435 [Ktedonobacteraceae bacterium]|nr:hypothetical protein [Ktedonobacteraceae bacterium]
MPARGITGFTCPFSREHYQVLLRLAVARVAAGEMDERGAVTQKGSVR